jgi:hypothetical protein
MEQPAHELEIVARRAHDRRDRGTPRAQLERRLDDDAIALGAADLAVDALDPELADLAHTAILAAATPAAGARSLGRGLSDEVLRFQIVERTRGVARMQA